MATTPGNSIGETTTGICGFTGTDFTGTAVTQHAVLVGGSTSSTLTSLGVAATGSTLMGTTGADPSFTGSPSFSGSVTAGTGITVTAGDVAISAGNLTLPLTTSTQGQVTFGTHRVLTYPNNNNNVFVGKSGNFTLSGSGNLSLGDNAILAITSGTNNLAFGNNSLQQLTTGIQNVCFGQGTGSAYTTSESNNIIIGHAVTGTIGESNVLRIGGGTGTGSGQINTAIISGISGATSASGVAVLVNTSNVLGTTTSSREYKTNIEDMSDQSNDIYKLRPVTFNYKPDESHVSEEDSKLKQWGLIAEEVEEVFPDLVHYNKDGKIESVRYLNLIPMLLNELQRLRQEVNELKGL